MLVHIFTVQIGTNAKSFREYAFENVEDTGLCDEFILLAIFLEGFNEAKFRENTRSCQRGENNFELNCYIYDIGGN